MSWNVGTLVSRKVGTTRRSRAFGMALLYNRRQQHRDGCRRHADVKQEEAELVGWQQPFPGGCERWPGACRAASARDVVLVRGYIFF